MSEVPVVLHRDRVEVRDGRPAPWRPHPLLAVAGVLALVVFALNLTPAGLVGIVLLTLAGLQATLAVDRGRVIAEELARAPEVVRAACAVADALQESGRSPVGAEAVRRTRRLPSLHTDDPEATAAFTEALDEVLAPVRSPRFLVPRWVLTRRVDNGDGVQAAFGRLRPDRAVWHSVPRVFADDPQAFARAWDHWVGGGAALDVRSAEGRAALAGQRAA